MFIITINKNYHHDQQQQSSSVIINQSTD